VAGYSPLRSGLALLLESLVMSALSSRFGALADRLGPRVFIGGGPLIAVAPLTAAILAGIDQTEAGIGSAVNNALARVAGLIATVAIGAIMAARFSSSLDDELAGQPLTPRGHAAVAEAKQLTLGRPSILAVPRQEAVAITVASGQSSLEAIRVGIGAASALVVLDGLIGAVGIPKPGGQLVGAPLDAAVCTPSPSRRCARASGWRRSAGWRRDVPLLASCGLPAFAPDRPCVRVRGVSVC
jgi:hypothetical protein